MTRILSIAGLMVLAAFGIILSCHSAFAQTTHSATLTWADTQNPAGTTYNVYRATGLCSGTPVFSKLASGLVPKTFTDPTVSPGNWCFQVTATTAGIESPASNTAQAPVPNFAPTQLQVTVQ